jgi:hypothetical protein
MSESMYAETERELNVTHLNNYGLNPVAVKMLVQDYKAYVSPYNTLVRYFGDEENEVHIYLKKPGYVGNRVGDVSKLRKFAVSMVAKSYYDYVNPRTIGFLFEGVEVTILLKGIKETKNIARNIFNPTK